MDLNGRQWTSMNGTFYFLQVLRIFGAAEIIAVAPAFWHAIAFPVIRFSGVVEVVSVAPGLGALEVQG